MGSFCSPRLQQPGYALLQRFKRRRGSRGRHMSHSVRLNSRFVSLAPVYLVRPIVEIGITPHFFNIIRKPTMPTTMVSVSMGTKQHQPSRESSSSDPICAKSNTWFNGMRAPRFLSPPKHRTPRIATRQQIRQQVQHLVLIERLEQAIGHRRCRRRFLLLDIGLFHLRHLR